MAIFLNSGTSSSTTSNVFVQAPTIAVTLNLPNGGTGRLIMTVEQFERFKRGARMIVGGWRTIPDSNLTPEQCAQNEREWEALTPQRRLQIETDADWLCHKLEQMKLGVAEQEWSRLSVGNGSPPATGRSSRPST
jgi:hypothetical protein